MKVIGNYGLDKFDHDADGRFETFASAAPQSGNWIQLDPESPRRNDRWRG